MGAGTAPTEWAVEQLQRQLQEATAALERAREELVQRERLALVGQIAVGIGHELRQPLSIISHLAYCLRLLCGPQEGGGAEKESSVRACSIREHLDRLELQVALANRVISNLLDYARSQQAERRPVDLNCLVQEHGRQFEVPGNIRLRIELAPGLAPVLADPLHLERVLLNLVTNSLQTMEATGGELRLRTYAEGQQVVLGVGDTGPGIPEELREKIFQPMFSTRSSGLGLGLALTRQLVEANGGEISFSSQPGVGTTFLVRLPVASR